MEANLVKNAVTMMHRLLQPVVATAHVLVDMTCGNGHDTAFLAAHMAPDAVLYAFDIQAEAIEQTRKRLADQQRQVIYQQGSHDELLAALTVTPDIILFNLGYLPNGSHEIYTKSEITVKAIKICLNKIAINGIIMIAAYPGTAAGAEETTAVQLFLQQVSQKEFDISVWQPVNQIHHPPVLYMIQKRG